MINFNSVGPKYILQEGAMKNFENILKHNGIKFNNCLIFIDSYFKNKNIPFKNKNNNFLFHYYDSSLEPNTDYIDDIIKIYKKKTVSKKIDLVIGYGGGSVLDLTKAFSIGYCQNKSIQNYQGWDPFIKKQ